MKSCTNNVLWDWELSKMSAIIFILASPLFLIAEIVIFRIPNAYWRVQYLIGELIYGEVQIIPVFRLELKNNP